MAKAQKFLLLSPIVLEEGRTIENKLQTLQQQGYARIKIKDEVLRIDEALKTKIKSDKNLFLVVDRIVFKEDEDFLNRLADAIETTFFEGVGTCIIESLATLKQTKFNNKFELDDMLFLEPNAHLFSFNNPYGACPKCEGYGDVIGIDDDLVIPNTALSIFENAIFPWRGESMSWYKRSIGQ